MSMKTARTHVSSLSFSVTVFPFILWLFLSHKPTNGHIYSEQSTHRVTVCECVQYCAMFPPSERQIKTCCVIKVHEKHFSRFAFLWKCVCVTYSCLIYLALKQWNNEFHNVGLRLTVGNDVFHVCNCLCLCAWVCVCLWVRALMKLN